MGSGSQMMLPDQLLEWLYLAFFWMMSSMEQQLYTSIGRILTMTPLITNLRSAN